MSLTKVACLSSICVVIIHEDVPGKGICLLHPTHSHSEAFSHRFTLFSLALLGLLYVQPKFSFGGLFSEQVRGPFPRKACSETTCHSLFWSNSPLSYFFLSVTVGINCSRCNYSPLPEAEGLASATPAGLQCPGQLKGPLEGHL